ncbi:MAG: nucleotide pyrophosphohydrolase [Chloroflexi bacterium]|nr:nucleotide pyrophosphohydrolase [Chloroflexota bacterium]
MQQIQREVNDFVTEHELQTDPTSRLLDLVSEVGEVAKAVLKGSDYGKKDFDPDREKWAEEVGDVLFSLICLANSTSVDLDSALQGVLNKYRERITMKSDAGS